MLLNKLFFVLIQLFIILNNFNARNVRKQRPYILQVN